MASTRASSGPAGPRREHSAGPGMRMRSSSGRRNRSPSCYYTWSGSLLRSCWGLHQVSWLKPGHTICTCTMYLPRRSYIRIPWFLRPTTTVMGLSSKNLMLDTETAGSSLYADFMRFTSSLGSPGVARSWDWKRLTSQTWRH